MRPVGYRFSTPWFDAEIGSTFLCGKVVISGADWNLHFFVRKQCRIWGWHLGYFGLGWFLLWVGEP